MAPKKSKKPAQNSSTKKSGKRKAFSAMQSSASYATSKASRETLSDKLIGKLQEEHLHSYIMQFLTELDQINLASTSLAEYIKMASPITINLSQAIENFYAFFAADIDFTRRLPMESKQPPVWVKQAAKLLQFIHITLPELAKIYDILTEDHRAKVDAVVEKYMNLLDEFESSEPLEVNSEEISGKSSTHAIGSTNENKIRQSLAAHFRAEISFRFSAIYNNYLTQPKFHKGILVEEGLSAQEANNIIDEKREAYAQVAAEHFITSAICRYGWHWHVNQFKFILKDLDSVASFKIWFSPSLSDQLDSRIEKMKVEFSKKKSAAAVRASKILSIFEFNIPAWFFLDGLYYHFRLQFSSYAHIYFYMKLLRYRWHPTTGGWTFDHYLTDRDFFTEYSEYSPPHLLLLLGKQMTQEDVMNLSLMPRNHGSLMNINNGSLMNIILIMGRLDWLKLLSLKQFLEFALVKPSPLTIDNSVITNRIIFISMANLSLLKMFLSKILALDVQFFSSKFDKKREALLKSPLKFQGIIDLKTLFTLSDNRLDFVIGVKHIEILKMFLHEILADNTQRTPQDPNSLFTEKNYFLRKCLQDAENIVWLKYYSIDSLMKLSPGKQCFILKASESSIQYFAAQLQNPNCNLFDRLERESNLASIPCLQNNGEYIKNIHKYYLLQTLTPDQLLQLDKQTFEILLLLSQVKKRIQLVADARYLNKAVQVLVTLRKNLIIKKVSSISPELEVKNEILINSYINPVFNFYLINLFTQKVFRINEHDVAECLKKRILQFIMFADNSQLTEEQINYFASRFTQIETVGYWLFLVNCYGKQDIFVGNVHMIEHYNNISRLKSLIAQFKENNKLRIDEGLKLRTESISLLDSFHRQGINLNKVNVKELENGDLVKSKKSSSSAEILQSTLSNEEVDHTQRLALNVYLPLSPEPASTSPITSSSSYDATAHLVQEPLQDYDEEKKNDNNDDTNSVNEEVCWDTLAAMVHEAPSIKSLFHLETGGESTFHRLWFECVQKEIGLLNMGQDWPNSITITLLSKVKSPEDINEYLWPLFTETPSDFPWILCDFVNSNAAEIKTHFIQQPRSGAMMKILSPQVSLIEKNFAFLLNKLKEWQAHNSVSSSVFPYASTFPPPSQAPGSTPSMPSTHYYAQQNQNLFFSLSESSSSASAPEAEQDNFPSSLRFA